MPAGRATRIRWTSLDRERAARVLRCGLRVLADSKRTLDIVEFEEITAQAQLRQLVADGVFETAEGRALIDDQPHLADADFAALRRSPDGTLGREWVRFLDEHGLDPQLTRQPTPYTDDPRCAYLMHRIRQSHDLWHVLLGLGTTGHEEVLVHAFSLAQTGLSSSVAIVLFGALKHMVLEARWSVLRHDLQAAHRAGVRAAPLLAVYWERHLQRDLEEVRAEYGLRLLGGAISGQRAPRAPS